MGSVATDFRVLEVLILDIAVELEDVGEFIQFRHDFPGLLQSVLVAGKPLL